MVVCVEGIIVFFGILKEVRYKEWVFRGVVLEEVREKELIRWVRNGMGGRGWVLSEVWCG